MANINDTKSHRRNSRMSVEKIQNQFSLYGDFLLLLNDNRKRLQKPLKVRVMVKMQLSK